MFIFFGLMITLPRKYSLLFQVFLSSFVRSRLFTIFPVIRQQTTYPLLFNSLKSKIIGWILLGIGTGLVIYGIYIGAPEVS